jgi:8-oxo-dGTP diphosphatase
MSIVKLIMEQNQAITVCAFIHHQGKLFLAKRASGKAFLPDKFELPGGHVEPGEDIRGTLVREIFEEFHMKIAIGDAFFAFTYENPVKETQSVEVVYFATFLGEIADIDMNPIDHSEFCWISEDQIEDFYQEADGEKAAWVRGFELLRTGRMNFGANSEPFLAG